MALVNRGLVANDPTVIGARTDAVARVGIRDWLAKVEGIKEGVGELVQVNRRLYDPLGTGKYRIPDVYIPGTGTILDGSIAYKTYATPQIRDFWSFAPGANVTIIRPSTFPSGGVSGSYSVVR
jgi:hypothetical protein